MSEKILAVIPCLNEEAHIGDLVRSLIADNKGLSLHIVVADGGSTDSTVEIVEALVAEHEQVSYLHNPKKIQSAAINLAVETYGDEAEWMIRLDAHAGYPADYCRVLTEEAKAQPEAGSIVVAMDTVGKAGFQKAVAAAQNSKLGNGGSAHRSADSEGQWVDHGHHALMRIDAFRAVGGYDESFSHNEDAELDVRLRAAGHKIWLTGKTVLTYYPRDRVGPLFRQYFNYGAGRARNILKHRLKPRVRQMIPAFVFPAAVLALLAPASFSFLAVPFWAWVFICLVYGVVLAVKAKDPEIGLAGPAAMVMHMGWSLGFWNGVLCEVMK